MLCGWFGGALEPGGVRTGGSGLAGEEVRRDAVTSTSTRGHPSLTGANPLRKGKRWAGSAEGRSRGLELATATHRDLDEDFGASAERLVPSRHPGQGPHLSCFLPPTRPKVTQPLDGRTGLGLDSQHWSCYPLSGAVVQDWFSPRELTLDLCCDAAWGPGM